MDIDQAIQNLSSSDPLIKLLQEVKLGRMKPTDPGLQAVTDSWLETYRRVVKQSAALSRTELLRLDPRPRLEVLASAGVLSPEHPLGASLTSCFDEVMVDAAKR